MDLIAASRAIAGVALCAALVSPALAGEWSASVGWGLRLDQHRVIPGTTGEPSAQVAPWTQFVLPTLQVAAEPLGARVRIAGSGRLELGTPVTGEGQGPLRRGSAGEVSTSVARTFGAGVRFTANGSAARSRDLLDVDQATVSDDGDAMRWGASSSARSRWLEGDWHAHGWRSGLGPPGDTRSLDWGARAFLDRSRLAAAFLGAREQRMEHQREVQLLARTALLGLQRNVVPGLGVTLELGVVREQIGEELELPRPSYGVELASHDTDLATQLRVRLAHELGNEFEFELGHRTGRANAWARVSSLVDVEGPGAVGPAVVQRAALGAGDTLAAATVLGIEASVARNRSYRDLPFEPIAAARLRAWVERRVQPWLSCRAGWDLLARDGHEAAPGFRRSRFEIQLLASSRSRP